MTYNGLSDYVQLNTNNIDPPGTLLYDTFSFEPNVYACPDLTAFAGYYDMFRINSVTFRITPYADTPIYNSNEPASMNPTLYMFTDTDGLANVPPFANQAELNNIIDRKGVYTRPLLGKKTHTIRWRPRTRTVQQLIGGASVWSTSGPRWIRTQYINVAHFGLYGMFVRRKYTGGFDPPVPFRVEVSYNVSFKKQI